MVAEPVTPMNGTFFMNSLGLLTDGSGAQRMQMDKYLQNCKVECAKRLLNHLYHPQTGDLDRKFWITFGKTPFLGQKFTTKNFHI